MIRKYGALIGLLLLLFPMVSNAQFVHPGIQHKKSDLERMRNEIELGIEPWASSYRNLAADDLSKYTYEVKGDPGWTVVSRGVTNNYAYEKDMVAAYQNALMFWLNGDQRHADKAIEILNTWSNLTYVGGIPLNVGLYGAPMINAAELIKYSNAGWATEDMQKFSDMLVHPGYSSTTIPQEDIDNDNYTFYWGIYNGDPKRAGNQELACYKTMLAMGIFLDNDTIYDRALRYISGQKHRPDDLPYEAGPKFSTTEISNNGYRILYDWRQEFSIEDYGYDGVLTNYIYENGQCQESSRDQTHAMYGVSLLSQIAEVAWNQGDDLYNYADNRILKGLEYHAKYNLSYQNTYPDQVEPWEPTVESGEFTEVLSRTARNYSLRICPYHDTDTTRILRGVNLTRPYWEMPLNHYINRTHFKPEDYKWLQRARDLNIAKTGTYEGRSASYTDHPGWGGLSYTRPEGCAGDPIVGMIKEVPVSGLHQIPGSIEAENFDFFTADGESFVYHDTDTTNTGLHYRLNESVDIDTCTDGGYMLMDLKNGEWLVYTIAVPETGLYNISIRYAADNANGKIKFSVADKDVSGNLAIPFGGENSTGLNDWKDIVIAKDIILNKGVQALKMHINGTDDAFVLNSFSLSKGNDNGCDGGQAEVSTPSTLVPGYNYSIYSGNWDTIPDFSVLNPIDSGLNDSIDFLEGWPASNFGLRYNTYINIPLNGNYTFYLLSNNMARVIVDGKVWLENEGDSPLMELSKSVCLNEGFHHLNIEYIQKTGDSKLALHFEGPGISKKKLQDVFAVGACENKPIDLPDNTNDGISYFYYKGEWDELPNFNVLTEENRGINPTISLDVAEAANNFALVFKGYFYVPADGDYTFYTKSDEGSRLYVDSTIVVYNDGLHTAREASGSVCLAKGYHELVVEYFQKTGSKSLSVQWESNDFSRKNFDELRTSPVTEKMEQTISYDPIPDKYLGETDFDPGAEASSGLPLSYFSYNTDVVRIVNNKVHIVGTGRTIISATQAGNVNYKSAQVLMWIVVLEKVDQTITFEEIPNKNLGDPDFNPGAYASSGLPITYKIYNPAVAVMVDSLVRIVGVGKTLIAAMQTGNNKYNAASNKVIYLNVFEKGTALESLQGSGVYVYPNPVNDELFIQLKEPQPAQIQLINMMGAVVQSKEMDGSGAINVAHLESGVFVLQLYQNGTIKRFKILKN